MHKVGTEGSEWEEVLNEKKTTVEMVALRPLKPKHVMGAWSHYTDTNEPVVDYGGGGGGVGGGTKYGHCLIRVRTSDLFMIISPTR
jgi:hypothetical protein